MIKPVQAHGNIKRQANKKLRRERIFNIAKSIIAAKGLEDFTIADLAEEAGVTTPTIHNLFGKKDDIAQELIEELVLSLKSIMSKPVFDDPIESANFYVDSILEMYEGNEDFYRSAYMAGEKAGIFNDRESEDSFFKQSEKVAELCCLGALKNGFLLGNIDINIITIGYEKDQKIAEASNNLYKELKEMGYDVLLDDRKDGYGTKIKDSELIGIPLNIIIGKQFLETGEIEFRTRSGETSLSNISDSKTILDFFK